MMIPKIIIGLILVLVCCIIGNSVVSKLTVWECIRFAIAITIGGQGVQILISLL